MGVDESLGVDKDVLRSLIRGIAGPLEEKQVELEEVSFDAEVFEVVTNKPFVKRRKRGKGKLVGGSLEMRVKRLEGQMNRLFEYLQGK